MGCIVNNIVAYSFIIFVLLLRLIVQVEAEDCNSECLSCPVGLPYHCTECDTGYYLTRGGAYLTCRKCPYGCAECDNTNACNSCMGGRYGSLCQNVCGKGCVNSECDQHLGLCGCKQNFSGTLCDRCIDGKYGYEFNNCELKCPENCKLCVSDKNCTQCQDGYYGLKCERTCPKGCFTKACIQNNGSCIGNNCNANFQGIKCDQCVSGLYGNGCDASCPSNCLSCSSQSSCDQCKPGYWGTKCQNNCSRGCFEKSCSIKSGVCKDKNCTAGFVGDMCNICVSGLTGVSCNINETLPENSSASIQIKVIHRYLAVFTVLLCVKILIGPVEDILNTKSVK